MIIKLMGIVNCTAAVVTHLPTTLHTEDIYRNAQFGSLRDLDR